MPQPSIQGGTGTAVGYGYTHAVLLASAGHLRVRVSSSGATVDYVSAYLPEQENGTTKVNGAVAYSYTVRGTGGASIHYFPGRTILGCTELPLILDKEACGIPFLNTTAIHAESIVKYCLKY